MPHIFPIGGGKGGSGKSFITANLGALFARQGRKVVLVDLDLGGSNLHTLVGLKNPGTGLHEFMNKNISDLAQAAVPTRIPNLFVITSMDCSMEIANLFHTQKQKIIRAVQKLPYEYILLATSSDGPTSSKSAAANITPLVSKTTAHWLQQD